MVTLLASIAGFIGSIIPELIKYLKDINDKKHELNIMDRQIEFSKSSRRKNIEEIEISRDLHEIAAMYSTYKTDIRWVDALNGTVRPMLAYSFFLMYLWVKTIQYKAIAATAPVISYIEVIWSIEDQAIFASIISFYFGQRTFKRLWNKNQ